MGDGMGIPGPEEIKATRQMLGLSDLGFAKGIGLAGKNENQRRAVRAMESGERGGEPFVMTSTAAQALRYLKGIAGALRKFDRGVTPAECLEDLRHILPEEMR
jgi:hypothetical protein